MIFYIIKLCTYTKIVYFLDEENIIYLLQKLLKFDFIIKDSQFLIKEKYNFLLYFFIKKIVYSSQKIQSAKYSKKLIFLFYFSFKFKKISKT